MTITYTTYAINYRMQELADAIDGGGTAGVLYLQNKKTVLSTIELARPCGTVDSGVLTFTGNLLDSGADATGVADNGIIKDSNGVLMISDLTVGIPLASADIIISNGLNSTLISSGQTVQALSAQITGS